MSSAESATPAASAAVAEYVARWSASGGSERANYTSFLSELCDLLGVRRPDPTTTDNAHNAYVFERDVTFQNQDGTTSTGRIDLYKRGCFVLEAKQGSSANTDDAPVLSSTPKRLKKGHGVRGTKGWDDAMLRARGQAEQYARALPVDEGWPVFLIVVDVGHSIELFADFTRSGKTYLPFPDPKSYRILLANLADFVPLLRTVWTDPQSLDPTRRAAKVTRELADRLAKLAKSLEQSRLEPGRVAQFLMRCLFTMFAEDVDLIPRDSFRHLLERLKPNPAKFPDMVRTLWEAMDKGTFHPVLEEKLRRFNGGLFEDCEALPLTADQLDLLIEASKAQWRDVEPAIFGTLLERALDPIERHKLGAHYTPRAYVERLVLPTLVEPLREDWDNCRTAALTLANRGETDAAVETVRDFHRQLCETRVLDPACGSGNFLYVALEHMKRLEGEVLNTLRDLGYKQREIITVDPHQFLGIEVNPRAAAIADLVLWIGYLQWHVRTRPLNDIAEPIIQKFHNIDCRDAVLAWDGVEPVLDDKGKPVTRWDGRTMKPHPVTGEAVPDDTARVPVVKYLNPRKADWPEAEFIVGNPPFVGNKRMKTALGDGYVEALRSTVTDVPGSADFVMYWWNEAAKLAAADRVRRFGLITTNSITQAFNRTVVESRISGAVSTKLIVAIPDHPWVDTADGAAVRVAMTAGTSGKSLVTPVVREIAAEESDTDGVMNVRFSDRVGDIHADLSCGTDHTSTVALSSNKGLAFTGMYPLGQGFVVSPEQMNPACGNDRDTGAVLRPYRTARDLTQTCRMSRIIDFYPRTQEDARKQFPSLFQWVLERVKPERDQNPVPERRRNWWLFTRPIPALRRGVESLRRFVVVPRTAKYFTFQFVTSDTIVDTTIVAIAVDDPWVLGVLSSRSHLTWALRTGGVLEDRPRYQHQQTFDPFPFPAPTDLQQARIRELGEQLDAHRKRQQALHPDLTLTGMYNVLEKLRAGEPLTAKEKTIHEQGLVSVLKQIHDDLDAAVCDAYGWPHDLTDEQILERLVALNAERAAEESRGVIRWLRPEFQNPAGQPVQKRMAIEPEEETPQRKGGKTAKPPATSTAGGKRAEAGKKSAWPKSLAAQVAAVSQQLQSATKPVTPADIAQGFTRAKADDIAELLDALVTLGKARTTKGGKYVAA